MIELHLCLRSHSQRLPSLLGALQSLERQAKLERGCVEVHLFAECHDPRSLYYTEMWDTEENLCLMLCSEHFTRLAELMETAAEPPVLDFRTIAAIRGLEFAQQARHNHEESAFTFDSGSDSYPEPKVNTPLAQDKAAGP
jgi:quinol monooxygenase YgiN